MKKRLGTFIFLFVVFGMIVNAQEMTTEESDRAWQNGIAQNTESCKEKPDAEDAFVKHKGPHMVPSTVVIGACDDTDSYVIETMNRIYEEDIPALGDASRYLSDEDQIVALADLDNMRYDLDILKRVVADMKTNEEIALLRPKIDDLTIIRDTLLEQSDVAVGKESREEWQKSIENGIGTTLGYLEGYQSALNPTDSDYQKLEALKMTVKTTVRNLVTEKKLLLADRELRSISDKLFSKDLLLSDKSTQVMNATAVDSLSNDASIADSLAVVSVMTSNEDVSQKIKEVVEQPAQAEERSQAGIEKNNSKGAILKLLFGPDGGSMAEIQSAIKENEDTIAVLNEAVLHISDGKLQELLSDQIALLRVKNAQLNAYINTQESAFSLF